MSDPEPTGAAAGGVGRAARGAGAGTERTGAEGTGAEGTGGEGTGAGRGGRGPGARELAAVVALCALGGGLVLGAAGQTWLRLSAQRRSPLADVTLSLSGRSLEPLVAGLGIVGLAGVVGLLATRRWGRLVVAGLLALSGLVIVVASVRWVGAPGPGTARDLIEDADRAGGLAANPAITATAHPAWPLLAALGGLLLALGGLAALVRSRRWPTMSARYENPTTRAQRPRTDAALWDALSRGDDPTAAETGAADPEATAPERRGPR
jgi:uncharacterized membrane protein (TIGR02234 family)